MKSRSNSRPGPPGKATHVPLPGRGPRHTTVPAASRHPTLLLQKPAPRVKIPRPAVPRPAARAPRAAVPRRQVARILDDDSTVLDLIDNLLSKGVMLNADVILALADVDLVYIRLSALLCAADRVLPHLRRRSRTSATG